MLQYPVLRSRLHKFSSRLLTLVFAITLLFSVGINASAEEISKAWANRQIDAIGEYARNCHPNRPAYECNPQIVRLWSDLAEKLAGEIGALCSRRNSKHAEECIKELQNLASSCAGARENAAAIQKMLYGNDHLGEFRLFATDFSLLMGYVEALKSMLPK